MGKKSVKVTLLLPRAHLRLLEDLLEQVCIGGEVCGVIVAGALARKRPLEGRTAHNGRCVGNEQNRSLLACMLWSLCFMAREEAGWGAVAPVKGESRVSFSIDMSHAWYERVERWLAATRLPAEAGIGALIERGLEELESRGEGALVALYSWQAAFGCMTERNFRRWGFQWWLEALQSNNPVGWWGSKPILPPPESPAAHTQSQTPFSAGLPVPPSNIYDGIELFPYIVLRNAECFAQDFVYCAANRARYDAKSKAGQPARNKRLAEARKQAKLAG